MKAESIALVLAWVILIVSWIIPFAFKSKPIARMVAIILSALSCGIFLCSSLHIIFK